VTIVVQCPHCETKFNLQPELVGKSMRCPNLQCRQAFVVREAARPIDPPLPLPPDEPENDNGEGPATGRARSKKSEKPRAAKPGNGQVVDAEVVEAAVVTPANVKEVVWSPSEATAKSPPKKRPAAAVAAKKKPLPVVHRRKKKKNRGPIILIGMTIVVVLAIGGTALKLLWFAEQSEKQEAEQAEKDFAKGDYGVALGEFEKLSKDYPDSENAPKYLFLRDLCDLERTTQNVANRDEPEPAAKKFLAFVDAQQKSEFAKTSAPGYGGKVFEAGKKLMDDFVGHAEDRVKAYRADRSGKALELKRAETSIALGRKILEKLELFRAGDEPPLDKYRGGLDQAEADVNREHARTVALAKASTQLKTISDAVIQNVQADISAAGFLSDPEAEVMIAEAKGRLRDLVKYEPSQALPVSPPAAASASILFVSEIGKTLPGAPGGTPSVFLAVSRGILYAIEENTGAMIWAVRVGQEITDPPTITRVDSDEGPVDLALVTSNVADEPALAAYVLRTGQVRWYQKLPAAAAGPAVVVGSRAFLPLRDDLGSIFEFDLSNGNRKGLIRLAQPVGPAAVVRPGTGLLYVAADARRVFVIDVNLKEADGSLKPPQCVQVIATGHPTGTLRTPPFLLGPGGDGPAERWLMLSQADGPNSMKIRAYRVPPIETAAADAKPPAETSVAPEAELPLRGWAWFPPVTDGERLSVVSDVGQLRIFEVKQTGNFDKTLFALPDPKVTFTAEGSLVRGVAFPAEETAFWSLSNGTLQKYRIGLIPARGVELLPVGAPLQLGEATQAPQMNNRNDAAFLVVRSQNSDGCKAVLLSLRDGAVRWQRQLGAIPAAPPFSVGDGLLLASRDGGILKIPAATEATNELGQTKVAPTSWVVATPPENATSTTSVAASADGKTLYTVTQITAIENLKPVAKWFVRKVVDGKVVHEGTVNAPTLLNGQPAYLIGAPVVLGESLLLPLATGNVYRHKAGTSRSNPDTLVEGPLWSTDHRIDASSKCYITPLLGDAFLTNDGAKKVSRWEWEREGKWKPSGSWDLPIPPAGPGLLIPAANPTSPPQIMIADVSGSIWLYPNDLGAKARSWRPGSSGIPSGRPTSALKMQKGAGGRCIVAYTVDDRTVVWIDPEQPKPVRIETSGEDVEASIVGGPQPLDNGRWSIADLSGRLTLFGPNSEKTVVTVRAPGAIPSSGTALLNNSTLLAPMSDGSTVILPATEARKEGARKEEAEGKE
jgi:hypothetical protein